MGVFPCVELSFRTDSTVLPQSLTRDTRTAVRVGWLALGAGVLENGAEVDAFMQAIRWANADSLFAHYSRA